MALYSFVFIIFLSFAPFGFCLNQEGLYLQSVKLSLDDPDSVLSSWNDRDDTPCSWFGISCDNTTHSVISIDISSTTISGPFPSVLCRLQNLTYISLFDNLINSSLPSDISACANLEYLDLSQNLLTGSLPSALSELSNLRYLDLTGNNFTGEIPSSFGRFQKLEVFSAVFNLLDGTIPPSLGNITSLKMLNLSYNPFSPGRIPSELGNLTNLEVLWLTKCNLVGEIPDSIGRLKRLILLDLATNDLSGPIPSSLTELTSAIQMELYNNSFSGELPSGFSSLTALRRFDASMNRLTGSIPAELCGLQLESLNLYENELEGNLPASIENSTALYELKLFKNRLAGDLPKNLGRNSPLRLLDVSFNRFTGRLPATLCEKGELTELLIIHNEFSGEIPASLGECRSLLRVRLGDNKLSGEVPAKLWGLPRVQLLELLNNALSGPISRKIVGAANLSVLIMSNNNFSGTIPEEIGFMENLVDFSGGNNRLSGRLPHSIVNMENLGSLNLENNMLSGELPTGIKSWKRLSELNVANNNFSGEIPEEIVSLPALTYLDLSRNQFSGKIPLGLQNAKLNLLNLSYNQLSGKLPTLFEDEMYRNSFLGNPGLCKRTENLCGRKNEPKSKEGLWLLRTIFILAGLVFIVGLVWFHLKFRKFREDKKANDHSKWTTISFHKLTFSEDEIFDCLDEDYIIGSGASGQVYKVVLSNGEIVAVKRLWGGATKSGEFEKDGFDAEVETLGKIRHKNIVKLWCCCSNKNIKLLVYEYMPNGSLGDLLHSSKAGLLDWAARCKIALDAAEGLSYLHHDCVPPIVHRDVKSNNILLDAEFGARIADFGVAKAVDLSQGEAASMSAVAGSCGYIAPEYAYTLKVGEKSDIYSFGVVILELITGRRPSDPELGEQDLVKWVCTTLEQKGIEQVIDPNIDSCFKKEISKVLNIGLLCASPLPINRPSMRKVVTLLREVRAGDDDSKMAKKDEKSTPYYQENTLDPANMV